MWLKSKLFTDYYVVNKNKPSWPITAQHVIKIGNSITRNWSVSVLWDYDKNPPAKLCHSSNIGFSWLPWRFLNTSVYSISVTAFANFQSIFLTESPRSLLFLLLFSLTFYLFSQVKLMLWECRKHIFHSILSKICYLEACPSAATHVGQQTNSHCAVKNTLFAATLRQQTVLTPRVFWAVGHPEHTKNLARNTNLLVPTKSVGGQLDACVQVCAHKEDCYW